MTKKNLVHGIDLTTPGGIEKLLEFHRARFGDSTMSAVESTDSTEATTTDTETVESTTAESTNSTDTETVDDADDNTDWKAEAEKWKNLSRKNEKKAETNYNLLTELQTKTAQFDPETFKNLEAERLGLLKKVVALEIGLPEGLIGRLQGSTEEELRADAELFKTDLSATTKKPVQPVARQGTETDVDLGPKKFKSAQEQLNAIKNNKL